MLTRIKYVNASVTELRANQGGGREDGREEEKLHVQIYKEKFRRGVRRVKV